LGQASGFWYHTGSSIFGVTQFDWDSAAGGSQNVLGGDTIIIASLGGGGLIIGDNITPADALDGTVTLTSSGGANAQVTLDSTISSTASTYNINDQIGPIIVNALTYNDNTSAGEILSIVTGDAADTVNVLSVFSNVSLKVLGNNGADQVNIGSVGSVQPIHGVVSISNTNSFTSIAINDQADSSPRTAVYTSTGVTGIAPASISWIASDVSSVTLAMGNATDTVNVQTVGIAPLTIHGTGGSDVVNIGNAGSVQGIVAPVKIDNAGSFTTLTIDDSSDFTGQTVTVGSGSVTGIAPAAINWDTADLSGVTLKNGIGADTVNVIVTSAQIPVVIQGTDGLDVVNIGDSGSVQGIMAPVTIQNAADYTALTIDDSADLPGRTVTVDFGSVTGIAPAAINWSTTDLNSVTLKNGISSDTVNVIATSATIPVSIQGTAGADTVNIGDAGSVQQINAPVAIFNAAAHTNVVVDDLADTTGREVVYSATGVSGVAPASISWKESDVSGIGILLGSGNNDVDVVSSAAQAATSVFIGLSSSRCFINGSGLHFGSSNVFTGQSGDDLFSISIVSTNVASVTINGGLGTDKIIYTGGVATGGMPGNGTLLPSDMAAKPIDYTSIELFGIGDFIFVDDFEVYNN